MHQVDKYTCIIVDDDELDRLTTKLFVGQYPFLKIVGVYDNAMEALTAAQREPPDVMFLDIDMENMTGLELRKTLGKKETCIYITSFPEHALESYELAALDFIVKPLSKERFAASMERLAAYVMLKQKAGLFEHSLGADTVFIKEGNDQVKIRLHEIIYLEALKDYTRIVTAAQRHCVLTSLGNLLKEPPFASFIRTHRSFAVQKHFIDKITAKEVIAANIRIPVGRSYKESLQQIIR